MKGKQGMVCMGLLLVLSSCHTGKQITASGLQRKDFQTEVNGQHTDLFTLSNKQGMEVCITNYGARVVSILVPDRNGKREDVVCGFSTITEYMEQRQNFGSTVGRYIGRILNARFTLDGVEYKLVPNNGKSGHISHGGNPGFADRIWKVEQADTHRVCLSYLSPDGENGFPGNLKVTLVYSLGEDDNALDLTYEATTDAPTVLNLSHHSFFNISGNFTKSVEDQQLWVDADRFTPYDDKKCVTGEYLPVAGTPLDFRMPHAIGECIDADHPQLKVVNGYDHTWELNTKGDDTRPAAWVYDPASGRKMEIFTTEPGMQIYTGNGLKGKMTGKGAPHGATRTSTPGPGALRSSRYKVYRTAIAHVGRGSAGIRDSESAPSSRSRCAASFHCCHARSPAGMSRSRIAAMTPLCL